MINIKFTAIDRQQNNITEDEFAICNLTDFDNLDVLFSRYDAELIVVTMTVIEEDGILSAAMEVVIDERTD